MTVAKKYGQIQELRSTIPLSDKVIGLKEAVAADAVNPQLWYELGLAYAEQQLYLEAEEAMSEAVSYSPFFTDAFAMKGDYHVRVGRYDEGAADLSMATHLTITNADYWLKFGIALYLGQEIYSIFFVQDNVANFMHLVGGACGTAFGFAMVRKKRDKR